MRRGYRWDIKDYPNGFENKNNTPFFANKSIKTNSLGLKAIVFFVKDREHLNRLFARESRVPSLEHTYKMYRYESSVSIKL